MQWIWISLIEQFLHIFCQILELLLEFIAEKHSTHRKILLIRQFPLAQTILPVQCLQSVHLLIFSDLQHHANSLVLHSEMADLANKLGTVLP